MHASHAEIINSVPDQVAAFLDENALTEEVLSIACSNGLSSNFVM
jgi:hypothetical protein